ncbi:TniQ family protein [Celeribacter halophilus]|uniref:TniQ family protein n=1 Tax=Celeribacter halophilus TaxID=576117 RepID=UPI002FD441A9
MFDLLLDLSVPRKGALNGAAAVIQKICGILGTDFDRAMHQTFHRGAGQSVQLGDHLFQDQRLLRGQFRVCPACLRNDIGSDLTDKTALNAYARMTWSISCFRVCPKHQLFLVHSPEPGPSHEFNQTWEAWLPEILDGDLD